MKELTRYINKLSAEDTFINFSGEKISLIDEAKSLENWFLKGETGDKVVLGVFLIKD